MSDFLSGTFNRSQMGTFLRWLSPTAASHSLLEIDPSELAHMGKTLVLIDVDNTLLPWRSHDIPKATLDWVASAKEAGLSLCILSNTRNPERLNNIASELGIRALRGKFKPSRAMYQEALKEFGCAPEQAIMIGDQLFTDILGANRSGIDAIWVRPSSQRDFIGTKVSRMGERIARGALYKHLDSEEIGHGLPQLSTAGGLIRAPIVGQFFRFCLVGGLSFIIDYCIRMTIQFAIPYDGGLLSDKIGASIAQSFPGLFSGIQSPKDAFFPIASGIGTVFGIINSFIWNRLWTFRIRGSENRGEQLTKFLLVSVIGMLLNVSLSSLLIHFVPGSDQVRTRITIVVASGLVAFWNFAGQKFFAFRRRSDEPVA